jgi:type I restriction enzyme R subunit
VQKSPLHFQPFDEQGEVRIYNHGFLPHWRQAGCTYFVTFRLADSIPRAVVDQWAYERECWLKARGIDLNCTEGKRVFSRLDGREQRQYEKHFATRMHDYLDRGHGSCILVNPACAEIVAEALDFFHGSRLDTGDYVVMPNHVHAMMTPYPGYELEDILQSIKSYTAKRILKHTMGHGSVWMKESYDHIVRDSTQLVRVQQYIRANPTKAHLREDQYVLVQAEYELVWSEDSSVWQR